ncbi:4369_t:CDS:2, partial [Funneliformis geosporum]
VTYLLEHYTKNATENLGWLIAISKALPDLYTHKLEYCVSELFYKRCMEGLEISNIIEHTDIVPKKYQITSDKFIAFNPISTLISTSEPTVNFKTLGNDLKLRLSKLYVKIFSKDYENYSPIVKIVPLHNFTVNSISQKTYDHESWFITKLLKLLLFPRSYFVNNSDNAKYFSQLSPFVQIIRSESNDDIFNNPVMEAVISYKWRPARNYFLRLFFVYILFAACFAIICGTYVAHFEATGYLCNSILFLIVLFYYLGYYLLYVEYRQFEHHGWRRYFNLFNCADLISSVTAIVVMSVCVAPSFNTQKAFANVATTQKITIAISFTMLLLWFEFILYLRLISEPAKYIYIMLNIIKETWLFLTFMILVMAGLAHSFLLLLQYPNFTNLKEISSKSTLFTVDSTNKIQNDFDRTEDNPAKNFIISFLSTYNWLNGAFLQQDAWDFWAVKFITFFGSILLVTILQNMFIAFMGGVYSKASEKGRVALLRFRAESISDYEALDEIYFYPPSPEPKYIYYIGKSKSYKEWNANVKKSKKKNLYHDYEKKMFERKLSYKQIDDDRFLFNNEDGYDLSDDDDSSECEEENEEEICVKGNEFNNNEPNEFNIHLEKKIDEVNSKIDKILMQSLSKVTEI